MFSAKADLDSDDKISTNFPEHLSGDFDRSQQCFLFSASRLPGWLAQTFRIPTARNPMDCGLDCEEPMHVWCQV